MIPVRKRHIRTRLALWYVAILAAVLALYIGTVLVFQYASQKAQMFHDEIQDVETVEGLLFFSGDGTLHLDESYHSKASSRLLADRLMEVRDLSGAVLYRSDTLHGMSLGGHVGPEEGTQTFDQRVVALADGTRVLAISHRHPVQGRMVVIRLGYSLAPFRDRMMRFFFLLLLALPLTLLLAGFAGQEFARRALSPLDVMTSRTERIHAENLHDRLPIENEHDELGHIGRVINQLLDRLQGAFEHLQRFTANAAHELRTPLAAMRSVGESALLEEAPGPVHKEAIASMLEEAARLHQTVEGLLLLARTDSAGLEVSAEPFRATEVVDEVVDLLEALLDERGLSVNQERQANADLELIGDRSLVRVALLNVLHNAAKFTAPDSTISVTYGTGENGAGVMQTIAVQDAGPGIPDTERELVFERFFMGEVQPKDAGRGSGLGLAIARSAIERSRGSIRFEGNVGAGARCVIELPARRSLG